MINNSKKGFSLFELLIVISIIGILTAIVSIAYSGAQKKTRDTRRVEDMKLIQTAAEQFYSQNNYAYPTSNVTPWIGIDNNILDVFPTDPKNVLPYVYSYPDNDGTSYCSCARVENINNGNSSSNVCTFASSGNYFCVKNQQ